MIRRAMLLAALLACGLKAQLTLYLLNAGAEAPVGAAYGFGTVLYGDTRVSAFRLRNSGTTDVSLATFSLAGAGFAVTSPAALPSGIAAGKDFDFSIGFTPTGSGYFSAYFSAANASTIFLGQGQAAPVISAADNGNPLSSGSTIDFGNVENGATAARSFKIENRLATGLTVQYIGVSGGFFQLVNPPATPLALAPGDSITVQITLGTSGATGTQRGGFDIDHWNATLIAQRVVPPVPQPSIAIDLPTVASAQQGRLAINLKTAARGSGQGQVSMEFHPGGPVTTDDAGIQFLATGSRTATFTVSTGDTAGRFAGQSAIEFQTGATAGEIVFTVRLGDYTETSKLVIPPAVIAVETASASRTSGGFEVNVSALDNTRATSILTFTFFDKHGAPLSPVQADATGAFLGFFDSSGMGGVFSLKAAFPVSGNADEVSSVKVQLTNAAGNTQTEMIPIS